MLNLRGQELQINSFIEGAVAKNTEDCSYILTAGSCFCPKEGKQLSESDLWVLEPGNKLILSVQEEVKVPKEIAAVYFPLDRLGKQGVMTLNAPFVKPGYRGYLSCILINFSQENIILEKGTQIARLCFFRTENLPDDFEKAYGEKDKEQAQYERMLKSHAIKLPESFMNSKAIKASIAESVKEELNKGLLRSSIFIVLTLFMIAMIGLGLKVIEGELLGKREGKAAVICE